MAKPIKLFTLNLLRNTLLVIAFFLLSCVSGLLFATDGFDVPFWPSAGLAAFMSFVYGRRVLPGIFVGHFVSSSFLLGRHIILNPLIAFISMAAAFQANLVGHMMRRIGIERALPCGFAGILLFLIILGPGGCWPSALAFWLVSHLTDSYGRPSLHAAISWWLGDSLGSLICFPILLVCFLPPASNPWVRLRSLLLPQLGILSCLPVVSLVLSRNVIPVRVFSFAQQASIGFTFFRLLIALNLTLCVMLGLALILISSASLLHNLGLLERSRLAASAAGAMSHEIAHPLLRLRFKLDQLYSDPALFACTDSSSRRKTLENRFQSIFGEVDRLSKLNASVRDLMISGIRDSSTADVRKAIESAVSQVQHLLNRYDQSLRLRINGTCVVGAGQVQLQVALRNILANACHAASEQGVIRLTCDRLNRFVRICIEDSGPGLPLGDLQPGLCTAASTNGGMGIGLTIVRRVVEDAGGAISFAQSPELRGALVEVLLPVEESDLLSLRLSNRDFDHSPTESVLDSDDE